MKTVLVTFVSGTDYGARRDTLEAAPGWHAADHGLDAASATLWFFDDGKAASAVEPLARSPYVTDVRLEDPPPTRRSTRRRRA